MKELTQAQIDKVCDALYEAKNLRGDFESDIKLDGLTVNATGCVDLNGYREGETGAWIETFRDAIVTLTAYDEDGEDIELDPSAEQAVYEFLNEPQQ